MSFLAIGATTIPVDIRPVRKQIVEAVDAGRAIDNSYSSRELAPTKVDIPIVTRLLTDAEYTAVKAALTAPPPLAATGTLVGAGISCVARIEFEEEMTVAAGRRRVIHLMLHQV